MDEWIFMTDDGKYSFTVKASNPSHAFDVAYETYGPQVEGMMCRIK